jgi:hypothetical protein
MLHPHTEKQFISNEMGHGVFATQFIPRGTLIWTLSDYDTIYTLEEVAKMPPSCYSFMQVYPYVDNRGNFILGCDIDIYCNHSCDPPIHNLGCTDNVIAIRDIQCGEEITYDYATNNIFYVLQCACKAVNCRQTVHNTDLLIYASLWEKSVRRVLAAAALVEQPLYSYIRDKQQFDAIISGTLELPPYSNMHCPAEIMNKLKTVLNSEVRETANSCTMP